MPDVAASMSEGRKDELTELPSVLLRSVNLPEKWVQQVSSNNKKLKSVLRFVNRLQSTSEIWKSKVCSRP